MIVIVIEFISHLRIDTRGEKEEKYNPTQQVYIIIQGTT